MAGTLTLVLLFMGGFALQTSAISNTNILVNPGFEKGDLTGWQDLSYSASGCTAPHVGVVSGPTYPTHTGTYALAMGGCVAVITQTFSPVFPVEISFWAQSPGSSPATACFDGYVFYSDKTGEQTFSDTCLPAGTWTQFFFCSIDQKP